MHVLNLALLSLHVVSARSLPSRPLENWLYTSEIDNTTLALLDRPDIIGVQSLYRWRDLESEEGGYDFSGIENDLQLVQAKGKKLWVQLQDRTFSLTDIPTPKYMQSPKYDNGSAPTCDGNNCDANFTQAGWMAPQWNANVGVKFQALLKAMAESLDGRIYGINPAETAIDVPDNTSGYTNDRYFEGELENAKYAAQVFNKSYAVQYVNFWPDGSETGIDYLPTSFAFYAKHGVGIGGPDLIPFNSVQENNSYPYFYEYRNKVPISVVAVQEPDLAKINPHTGKPFTKQEFIDYAVNKLVVSIIFWATSSLWLNSTSGVV